MAVGAGVCVDVAMDVETVLGVGAGLWVVVLAVGVAQYPQQRTLIS